MTATYFKRGQYKTQLLAGGNHSQYVKEDVPMQSCAFWTQSDEVQMLLSGQEKIAKWQYTLSFLCTLEF